MVKNFLVLYLTRLFEWEKEHQAINSVCLNLACGDDIREGWISCDIDTKGDSRILRLDLRDEDAIERLGKTKFHVIEMNHGLQYLNFIQAVRVLEQCFNSLSVGGELCLELPDPELIAKNFLDNINETEARKYVENIRAFYAFDLEDAYDVSFRGSTYQFTWSRSFIRETLLKIGFSKIEFRFPTTHGCRLERDYRICAKKERASC